MNRFHKKLSAIIAALVGTAMLAAPSPARAAFSVRVYDDGVLQPGVFFGGSNNSLVYSGSTTHFDITNGSALSNWSGLQSGSTMSLGNNTSITPTFFPVGPSTHTIRIELSEDGWLAPTGNLLALSSSAGGSMAVTSTTTDAQSVTSTYQGFLDNTNTLFGKPGGASTPVQNASATLNGTGTAPLNYNPGTSTNDTAPGGTPFSLTEVLEFTFTLNPGFDSVGATASDSTSVRPSAVPAPAGIILALSGTPVLGIGAWFRRRRTAS
jgi:hypothetical protein